MPSFCLLLHPCWGGESLLSHTLSHCWTKPSWLPSHQPQILLYFVHCSQVHPSLPSLLDSAVSCKSGHCSAPFPGQFSCSCSLINSFRVRCFFLSNSSCKLESHVPQMILSLIRRSFMSLTYMCMPEFSTTQCKHLSSSCFRDLEKSIPLLPPEHFPQILFPAVSGFLHSFLAILFHSFILSGESIRKLYLHLVIFIPFVRLMYRHSSSTWAWNLGPSVLYSEMSGALQGVTLPTSRCC